MNGVDGGAHTKFVGSAVGDSRSDASAGHPYGKGVGMVVAPPAFAVFELALYKGGSSEFAAPYYKGVVQQSSLL